MLLYPTENFASVKNKGYLWTFRTMISYIFGSGLSRLDCMILVNFSFGNEALSFATGEQYNSKFDHGERSVTTKCREGRLISVLVIKNTDAVQKYRYLTAYNVLHNNEDLRLLPPTYMKYCMVNNPLSTIWGLVLKLMCRLQINFIVIN